jgi:putative Mg2+ transporter-C (MgtC) family protein
VDENIAAFDVVDIALRLGAAVVVGVVIGVNRDLTNKPIGMRTLGLVSLGAAVVSLSTIHFEGLANHPDALSRVVQGIIQGIMAGIGFILRDVQTHTVTGLTTAATVWVTAALGIACALAAWKIVGLSVAFALFLLVGLGWVEGFYSRDAGNAQK